MSRASASANRAASALPVWWDSIIRAWLMGLSLLVASPAFAEPSDATITSKPVGAFEHSQQDRTSFGRLDYVGGLVLRSTNQHFGALSGLVVQPDGAMLAVTDTGFWVTAQIKRDADRRPQSLSNARVGPLLDERGQAFEHKWDADAEALTLRNNRAFVAYEQDARVMAYRRDGAGGIVGAGRTVARIGRDVIRRSFGLEALVAMPDGKLLAISEDAPKGEDAARALLIGIAGTETLSVKLSDGYFITDATLLPGSGDVLLLERNFTPARGADIRLRRILRDDIVAGAVLDGDVWLEAGRGFAVENLEGLSAFEDDEGRTRLALVSDDNHWPLQRTIYLEFILRDAD